MRAVVIPLAAVCSLAFGSAYAQSADTIYHNGSILTMAGRSPAYVEALVVTDGRIVYVEGKDDALKMRGEATKVVDLGRKAMLPGFPDADRLGSTA